MTIQGEEFLFRGTDGTVRGSSFIPAKNGIIFSRVLPGTSFVYSQALGVNDGDGKIMCGLMLYKTVQVVGNLAAATNFIVQIEGRVHEEMPWSIIFTRTYDDVGAISEFIPAIERVMYVRVGIKTTGTGGANDWITVGFNFSR